jgi:hypothetical protein
MTSRAYVPFTVLNYLITKATIQGTEDAASIRIPYADLLASIGKQIETEDDKQNAQLDLVVNIQLSWEEHIDDADQTVEMDMDFNEDYKD